MEKKLIFILLSMLLLFGCKGKPVQEPVQNIEQEPAYTESVAEPEQTIEKPGPTTGSLAKFEYTWSNSDDMPDVVIIIDDFGNSAGQLLDDFARLPSEIVFAVLPDLPHTKAAASIAAQHGHEVIIHIPMEAENSNVSPGQRYIAKDMPEERIGELIHDFLAQMPMAVAANNHMGSATTANLSTMNNIIKHLSRNGLFFIDSATTAKSAVFAAAREQEAFSAKRDIFLDVPDNSDATLASKIQSLGKYKGRREPIIIITHCHNREKLEALQRFIVQIEGMGLRIVSLRDAFPRARA